MEDKILKEEETINETDSLFFKKTINILRSEIGFGINIMGTKEEGGNLKIIDGEFYLPLQYVSHILPNSPAHLADLKVDDRILEVNGLNVEGRIHQDVIELIRLTIGPLTLTVLRPNKLCDASASTSSLSSSLTSTVSPVNMTNERQISIPDYQNVQYNSNKFLVYRIFVGTKHLVSRCYKDFDKLQNLLRKIFMAYNLPCIPARRLLPLNERQLEQRRRGLEKYLIAAASVPVLYESDVMYQFLQLQKLDKMKEDEVKVEIILPDNSLVSLNIMPSFTTETILLNIFEKLTLHSLSSFQHFALYKIEEDAFERKLENYEMPFIDMDKSFQLQTNIQRIIVSFKKWIFSPVLEKIICRDPIIEKLIYNQAVKTLNIGEFQPDAQRSLANYDDLMKCLLELECANKITGFLENIRSFDGYNRLTFPHCPCDIRKNGHIIASVDYNHFTMHSCSTCGKLEKQVLLINWDHIKSFEASSNEFSFIFSSIERGTRNITVYTNYATFLREAFDKVYKERNLNQ